MHAEPISSACLLLFPAINQRQRFSLRCATAQFGRFQVNGCLCVQKCVLTAPIYDNIMALLLSCRFVEGWKMHRRCIKGKFPHIFFLFSAMWSRDFHNRRSNCRIWWACADLTIYINIEIYLHILAQIYISVQVPQLFWPPSSPLKSFVAHAISCCENQFVGCLVFFAVVTLQNCLCNKAAFHELWLFQLWVPFRNLFCRCFSFVSWTGWRFFSSYFFAFVFVFYF